MMQPPMPNFGSFNNFNNPFTQMASIGNQLQQLQNPQPLSLVYVNGIAGANAYNIPPNSMVALFDQNSDIMYIKTSDGAGYSSVKEYSYTEIQNNQPTVGNFVTQEEFNQFKQEVLNGKQSVQPEHVAPRYATESEPDETTGSTTNQRGK